MFDTLTSSFTSAIKKIRFHDDEKALKKALDELKKNLLKADVNHKVVKQLLSDVEIDVKTAGIGKDQFLSSMQKRLHELLLVPGHQGFVFASKPPTTILMMGLQGSGKTTTTGKLAYYLKSKQKKVLIAAADLQRMAAVEQLKQVGASVEVDVYADENEKDPVKIAKAAMKKAEEGLYDVLLIDTAGRLAIDEAMMTEIANIHKAIEPQETLFVVDSRTGQDAVNTAKAFNERLNFDGVILTKLDGDTRGGAAISIKSVVNKPIKFIGTGEKMDAIDVFYPSRMADRILGMGDVVSLVERAQEQYDEEEARKLQKKIAKNEFGFDDFLSQLQQIKKMGSMKDLMGMIPGAGKMLKDVDIDDDAFKHIEAIIHSMTPAERSKPTMINASRKKRIGQGSGTSVQQVNQLLKQFNQMSKMMKMMQGGGGRKMMQMMKNMR